MILTMKLLDNGCISCFRDNLNIAALHGFNLNEHEKKYNTIANWMRAWNEVGRTWNVNWGYTNVLNLSMVWNLIEKNDIFSDEQFISMEIARKKRNFVLLTVTNCTKTISLIGCWSWTRSVAQKLIMQFLFKQLVAFK